MVPASGISAPALPAICASRSKAALCTSEVISFPALRIRGRQEASGARARPAVSSTVLTSKTLRFQTRKPACARRLRSARISATLSLISISFGAGCHRSVYCSWSPSWCFRKSWSIGFPPAEALFTPCQNSIVRLSQLPAEVNFRAPKERRKIQKPDIQIFDNAPESLDALR